MNAPIEISSYTMRSLNSLLRKQCGNPKNGRSRKVYIDKTNRIVYKLPVISSANHFNAQEYKNYLAYYCGESIVKVAEWAIFYTSDGVAILVMELVRDYYNTYKTLKGLPEWALHGNVDDYQVGINDQNDIVAYDHTRGI
jgi:hypothetical protein